MLVDKPVSELLRAFSSTEPTPGGGSASALASAVGASLLIMVAGLPKTRTDAPDERTALQDASNQIGVLRDRLTGAIDADTAAYDRVVAAYRMPKASADDQAARQAAIQGALRGATDVPLDVIRWSAQVLEHAVSVARYGLSSAASDVGVGVALLKAGAAGARLNVDINVGSVKDSNYVEAVRSETRQLTDALERSSVAVSAALS